MSETTAPKVLIVDDDLLSRQIISDLVRRAGYAPTTVESARNAIGVLADLQPLAVLLDMYMPEDPGDACCKVIKGNSELAHLPVIFMSGSTTARDVQRAFFAGADDFMPKPIREQLLHSKRRSQSLGR